MQKTITRRQIIKSRVKFKLNTRHNLLWITHIEEKWIFELHGKKEATLEIADKST